jgi:hypothetical protein
MVISLGPMPPELRETVGRWITEGKASHPATVSEPFNAVVIQGGPDGACYLDADGQFWSWDAWDNVFTRVEDDLTKVGLIAVAAEHLPELAAWLPRRPPEAMDCAICKGSGRSLSPGPQMQCQECVGLGWVLPTSHG